MTRRSSSPAASRSRSVRSLAALALASATFGLAGCQWTSPITTQLEYDAGDGVSAQVGDVHILNALIVAESEGGAGTMAGTLDNRGRDAATVPITVGSAQVAQVEVPAGQTVQLSDASAGKLTRVPAVSQPPGAMIEVKFGDATANVPVLAPHDPYQQLAPGGGSTTSGSPTASPTESPGQTGSPTTSAAGGH